LLVGTECPDGLDSGHRDGSTPSEWGDSPGEGIARQMCQGAGGTWDSAAGNCIQ
jgi:hypothetical protein